MEFKGTPGPWIITDSGGSIMDSDQFIIATSHRLAVLCRWYEKGFEHFSDEGASKDIGTIAAKANANLIAAAPEMLDALIKIVEMNQQYAIDKYGDVRKAEEMACVRTARAAINKALGRE
ncbi:hypothetical protein ABN085_02445 [Morganella morganii]|uniref:hypothetical protein n=1 Tax=Morganella morganii TaxID=582 RepID=UPI0032DB445C